MNESGEPLSLCLSRLVSLPLSFGKGIEDFLFFFSPGLLILFCPAKLEVIADIIIERERWRTRTIMKFLSVRWSKFVRHVLKGKAIHVQEILTTFGD